MMIQIVLFAERDYIVGHTKFHAIPPIADVVMREILEFIDKPIFKNKEVHKIEITKWEK